MRPPSHTVAPAAWRRASVVRIRGGTWPIASVNEPRGHASSVQYQRALRHRILTGRPPPDASPSAATSRDAASPPSATPSAPSSPAQTTGEGETAEPAAPTKSGKDAPKHGGKGRP
jgi:hypothetical protein